MKILSHLNALFLSMALALTGGVCPILLAQEDEDLGALFSGLPPVTSAPREQQQVVDSFAPHHESLLVDKKKKKFPGWGPYMRDFKALCAALASDGRSLELAAVLEPHLDRELVCPACYPLYKALNKSCRARKVKLAKKSKKSEENEQTKSVESELPAVATARPRLIQRELNLTVYVILQNIIDRLKEDKKRHEEGRDALRQFAILITSAETNNTSLASRDYFTVVAEHLLPNFANHKGRDSEHQMEQAFGDDFHVSNSEVDSIDELFN